MSNSTMDDSPGWQCCFCGEGIEANDPLAVTAQITNIHAEPGPDVPVQTLFAHAACMTAALTPGFCFDAEALRKE